MTDMRSGETTGRCAADQNAVDPITLAHRNPADTHTKPQFGHRIRSLLLKSVIIVGVAITPIWIGVLLWLAYRIAAWAMN